MSVYLFVCPQESRDDQTDGTDADASRLRLLVPHPFYFTLCPQNANANANANPEPKAQPSLSLNRLINGKRKEWRKIKQIRQSNNSHNPQPSHPKPRDAGHDIERTVGLVGHSPTDFVKAALDELHMSQIDLSMFLDCHIQGRRHTPPVKPDR